MNKLNQLSQLQLKGGWQLRSIGAHSKFNQSDSLSWILNNGKGTNQIVTFHDMEPWAATPIAATYSHFPYTVSSGPPESESLWGTYECINPSYASNQCVKYSDLKFTKRKNSGSIKYTIKAPSTYNYGIYAMIWIASPDLSFSSASNLNTFTIVDALNGHGSGIVNYYNNGSGIIQGSYQIWPFDNGRGEYSYYGIVNYRGYLAVKPIEKVSVGVRVLWRGTGSYTEFYRYLVKDYFTTSHTITVYENLDLGVIS